jgi:hypothetical protein
MDIVHYRQGWTITSQSCRKLCPQFLLPRPVYFSPHRLVAPRLPPWATLSAAIATSFAAFVALFLRELRASLRPPKLEMQLSRENGLSVTSHLYSPGQVRLLDYREERSRYYHLKVSNRRRKANAVHAPGGETKVVGTLAEADLCSVVRDKWLALHVKLVPNDLKVRYELGEDMPVDIIVTVQARGNEVDSEERRWRIYWDGQWEYGDVEMQSTSTPSSRIGVPHAPGRVVTSQAGRDSRPGS